MVEPSMRVYRGPSDDLRVVIIMPPSVLCMVVAAHSYTYSE